MLGESSAWEGGHECKVVVPQQERHVLEYGADRIGGFEACFDGIPIRKANLQNETSLLRFT